MATNSHRAELKRDMEQNVDAIRGLIRMLSDKVDNLAEDGSVNDLDRIRERLLDEVAGDDQTKRTSVESRAAEYYTARNAAGKRVRISVPA